MVHTATEAADELAKEGFEVEVLDLRTLIPWDKERVLEGVQRCSKVLVLHEDTRTGGFGAEIAATIAEEAFEHLDAPVMRLAAPDTPVPFSPPLEKAFIPQVEDVVKRSERARRVLTRGGTVSTGTQTEVVMPQMGVSVSEGTVTKWLKQVGDAIGRDEPLLEISTDKVDTEVPSPAEGVVAQILVQEGETVEVGTVLATIAPAGAESAPAEPAPGRSPPRRPGRRRPTPEPRASRRLRRPLPRPPRPPACSPPRLHRPSTPGGRRERKDLRLPRRRAHRRRARHRPLGGSRAPAPAAA